MDPEDIQKFDTPLPGELVERIKAEKIINDFRERFRKADPSQTPSNLPIACVLRGSKDKDILQSPKLLGKHQILFFLESASLLYSTKPQAVLDYLSKRQPWEDYDLCVFDESLEWCIGITHNDDIIVSDPNKALD